MRIEFKKISFSPKNFSFNLVADTYDVRVTGSVVRTDDGLFKIDSKVVGKLFLICYLSGDEFVREYDETMLFFAKDGFCDRDENNLYVIEFLDGYIDLEYIFRSELDSIQLDYHSK